MSKLALAASVRPQILYKLTAIKRDSHGNEVSRRESAEIPNVFTNHGVEQMLGPTAAGQPGLVGAVVGTGNAPPAITDTALQTFLAGRFNAQSPVPALTDLGGGQAYVQTTYNTVFPAGVATGNISEVGAAFSGGSNPTSSTLLCSRALVVDGGGNPTTFEVQADEELQLTQFFRNYVNYAQRSQVVNVNGTNYTVAWQPMGLANMWNVFGTMNGGLDPLARILYGASYTFANPVTTGQMSSDGGSDNTAQGTQSGVDAYVTNSKQRSCWLRRPTGAAQTIAGAEFRIGGRAWQVGFTPSIPKSALERFTVGMMFSVDNTP